jgi:hypothetical protein
MICLTILPVVQIVYQRRVEQSAKDEMGRLWKKFVMTRFKLLSRHLPGGIEENHEEHTEYVVQMRRLGIYEYVGGVLFETLPEH